MSRVLVDVVTRKLKEDGRTRSRNLLVHTFLTSNASRSNNAVNSDRGAVCRIRNVAGLVSCNAKCHR